MKALIQRAYDERGGIFSFKAKSNIGLQLDVCKITNIATLKGIKKMGAMTFCGGGHVPHRDENGRLIQEASPYQGVYTGWAAVSPSEQRHREEQEHAERDSNPRYLHR